MYLEDEMRDHYHTYFWGDKEIIDPEPALVALSTLVSKEPAEVRALVRLISASTAALTKRAFFFG